jgi:uncharacterized protein
VPDIPEGYDNLDCSFAPLNISLQNAQATTMMSIVAAIQGFISNPKNQRPDYKMSLAGGNVGIAAATDRVIRLANTYMLIGIYVAVSLLCFVAFRSWLAVLCAVLPLVLTSLLCQALMVAWASESRWQRFRWLPWV